MATVLPASGGGAVGADVVEHLPLGAGHVDAVGELLEQPGLLVHLTHEGHHLLQGGVRRLDDHVDALTEHVQLEVGDQRRDLDEGVGPEVQAGHLAVDPHESVRHGSTPYAPALPLVRAAPAASPPSLRPSP